MPKLSPVKLTEPIQIADGQTITYSRDFKTIKEVAAHIGCSRWTIVRYMQGETDWAPLRKYKLQYIDELENTEGKISQPQLEENA